MFVIAVPNVRLDTQPAKNTSRRFAIEARVGVQFLGMRERVLRSRLRP